MKKATRRHTRDHNTRLVLRTIYRQNGISRAAIARATHLTRPTVSTIVNHLLDEKFVAETGVGPSAGGKRPTLLDIDAGAYRLLCLDLGSRTFRGALINLRGEITDRAQFTIGDKGGKKALQLLYRLIELLRESATTPLLGIGVGTPGLVDPRTGTVREALNLEWRDLPLKALLEARYDVATYVANDSQAGALGEFTFGLDHHGDAGPQSRNLILINVGQGIGAGIVLDAQPFYGDHFAAGEIGHVVVAPDGPPCRCGNDGCLQAVAGSEGLLRRVEQARGGKITWHELVTAFHESDPAVNQFVRETGRYLGIALANLAATLNVNHIVLAGEISQFGDTLLDVARGEARRHTLPALVDRLTLRHSQLGTDIVVLGASALVLKHELGVV